MIQLKQDPARDSARYTLVLLPARRPLLQAMQLGGEDGSEAELRQPARGAEEMRTTSPPAALTCGLG